jgi:hypothetical protein
MLDLKNYTTGNVSTYNVILKRFRVTIFAVEK